MNKPSNKQALELSRMSRSFKESPADHTNKTCF